MLSSLEQVDPTQILDIGVDIHGDTSPRELKYSMTFSEWTATFITVQLDVNNPLLLSQGKISDKLKIKIKKPELFVSEESGTSLTEDQD